MKPHLPLFLLTALVLPAAAANVTVAEPFTIAAGQTSTFSSPDGYVNLQPAVKGESTLGEIAGTLAIDAATYAYVNGTGSADCQTTVRVLDGGKLTAKSTKSLYVNRGTTLAIDAGGKAVFNVGGNVVINYAKLDVGGTMTSQNSVYVQNTSQAVIRDGGDLSVTSYGYLQLAESAKLTVEEGGKMSGGTLALGNNSAIENHGLFNNYNARMGNSFIVKESVFDNYGEHKNAALSIETGSSYNNHEGATFSATSQVRLFNAHFTNSGTVTGGNWDFEGDSTLTNEVGGTMNFRLSTDSRQGVDGTTKITNHGAMTLYNLRVNEQAVVRNTGTLALTSPTVTLSGSGTLDNEGTLKATSTYSTLNVVMNDQSRFVTGRIDVAGHGSGDTPTDWIPEFASTGLGNTVSVSVSTGEGNVEIGTHLVSADGTLQMLSEQEVDKVSSLLTGTLNIKGATDRIHWVHRLTDVQLEMRANAGNADTNSYELSGGSSVVKAETEAEKAVVGTIGSYQTAGDTAAHYRLDEKSENNRLEWQGNAVETVAGETTNIVSGTELSVGTLNGETGKHEGSVVVKSTTVLNNSGAIDANVQVESDAALTNDKTISGKVTVESGSAAVNTQQASIGGGVLVKSAAVMQNDGVIAEQTTVEQGGTLKGSGTFGATQVEGSLIVGNSPGLQTYTDDLVFGNSATITFSVAGTTAATEGNSGWESGTYSQIFMKDGAAVTLSPAASLVIAFGGSELCSSVEPLGTLDQAFVLELIRGGVDFSDTLLDTLNTMDTTSFILSAEEGAIPMMTEGYNLWSLSVTDAVYSVQGDSLVLSGTVHLTRTPEPATATLSLLALAALAARRRA